MAKNRGNTTKSKVNVWNLNNTKWLQKTKNFLLRTSGGVMGDFVGVESVINLCACEKFTNFVFYEILTFYKNMYIINTKWLQIYCISISMFVKFIVLF